MHTFELSFAAALLAATPLLLAATGEFFGEILGMMNVGIEGLMLMGAVTGVIVTLHTNSPELGLFAGALAGALYLLIVYGIPVVLLMTEQVLPGFAVWFIGLGISQLLGNNYENTSVSSSSTIINLPGVDRIPVVREMIGSFPWPVYIAFVLPFGVAWLFGHTRHGRNMRAIGENPATASTGAGIAVTKWRLFYVGVNGFFGGFAGAFLAVVAVGSWGPDVTAGRGFIALAVVIFSAWRARWLIVGAAFFGGLLILVELGGALAWPISPDFLSMFPYLGAVIVLVIWSIRGRRSEQSTAPSSLGAKVTSRR